MKIETFRVGVIEGVALPTNDMGGVLLPFELGEIFNTLHPIYLTA